jgi:chromosome segregation ATPase
MSRTLWSLLVVLTLAACSSMRSEKRPVEAPPPTTGPQAGAAQAAPGAPEQRAAQGPSEEQAALARIQSRLDEANRELQSARSEVTASEQDLQRARQQADAAGRSDDALVRARAVEAVNVAQDRHRVASAHAAYAQQLVDARNAEVEAARAHLQAVDVQRTPPSDPSRNERIAEATRAEDAARARATDLGKKALAAEKEWQALAQASQASRGSTGAASAAPPASASGTGSSASDASAPATTPPSPPAPRP